MPVDDALEADQLLKIISYTTGPKRYRNKKRSAEALIPQVNTVFARAMNKIIFDQNIQNSISQKDFFPQPIYLLSPKRTKVNESEVSHILEGYTFADFANNLKKFKVSSPFSLQINSDSFNLFCREKKLLMLL